MRCFRFWVLSFLLIAPVTAFGEETAETPEPEIPEPVLEQRLILDETGTMHRGAVQPQTLNAVPPERLDDVDDATLDQLARRIDKTVRKKGGHHLPPLRIATPADQKNAAPPKYPASELGGPPAKAPDSLVITRNTDPSSVAAPGFSSFVNEPSVVKVANQVFYTANWYIAHSTDAGQNFSLVNPFAGPFASTGNGFCCDQVSTYDPGHNTIFLMQQYLDNGTTGVQRINVDQDANGTFDCFYDISPQVHGFASGTWFDFPDLTVSNNYLWHASNVFTTPGGAFAGAMVARYNLDALADCSSVPFDTYTDTTYSSFRLTRGATRVMYFADHNSTSSLRIWTWPETRSVPVAADRTVSTWANATRACPKDSGDVCNFIDRRIQGAFVADGVVGFMWVPSQDGSFPLPYTRVSRFTEGSLALQDEPTIWSGSNAWIYPSAAVNQQGDVGGTLMVAGQNLDPGCIAWISDDVNGDQLAPLENIVGLLGSTTPAKITRSGDYTWAQADFPNNRQWVGACYALTSGSVGDSRFLMFGREKFNDSIFADGFSSGETLMWSGDAP